MIKRGAWVTVFFSIAVSIMLVISLGESRPFQFPVRDRIAANLHLLSNGDLLLVGGFALVPQQQSLFKRFRDEFYMLVLHKAPIRIINYRPLDIEPVEQFQLYDLKTNSWSTTGPTLIAKQSLSLMDDRILMLSDKNKLSIYDNSSQKQEDCDPAPFDLSFLHWILLKNGKVLMVIRHSSVLTIFSVEFDPVLKRFDLGSVRNLDRKDWGRSLQCSSDGRVLLVSHEGIGTPGCDLYDPERQKWVRLSDLSESKTDCEIALNNGRFLIIYKSTGHCELLDPKTGLRSKAAPVMPMATDGLSQTDPAVLLNDGRVLYMNSPCQIYDPATDKWTMTGAMPTIRNRGSTHLLNDGKVLVAGGWVNTKSVASCELYDPVTGTWTEL